ncbi:hypothetical protein [Nostoc sp.]|uniref:hypothetical protein n=1 Tax=Nostoc sp. TaxID=1180 RepID=UPI002AD947F7|nr:hypothetical protein [Nostoc sp. EkiNYC01]
MSKNNPRIITTKQLSDLRNEIKKFGLLLPAVYNKQTSNIVDLDEKAETRLGLALNRIK